MRNLEVMVIGGGAAGFFGAIACAEAHPHCRVTILEHARDVLGKVRLSGGGRCNLTNACFEPRLLAAHYPRGRRELLGPFQRFQPRDTMAWFESRGVKLTTEPDGRVFPASGKAQAVVDVLTQAARAAGVETRTGVEITSLSAATPVGERQPAPSRFTISLRDGTQVQADRLLLATGSNRHGYRWAEELGHTIEPPVPSLFTFTVPDPRLQGLAGVSVENATLRLASTRLSQSGPLLVTHEGLSGPVVLTLSAWGARVLHDLDYRTKLHVNWLSLAEDEARQQLRSAREAQARTTIAARCPFALPRRLWERLTCAAGLEPGLRWSELSTARLNRLAAELTAGSYDITGRGEFKEEFVTCGGVRLSEVDFRTMASRRCPGLYFAGEVLDVDGVTGGFNLQNAWTTGWLAGLAMGSR